ncbi:hypothetical protein G9A89_006820 [Geosiphon pyriformis]|nr:hypothetical protein G9A89_006820 [Geosiphon pyriformis]
MSSVSKQKRLAKKAAKGTASPVLPVSSSKNKNVEENLNGSQTPVSNSSVENLNSAFDSLKLSSERTATGVLASQSRSRDVKIEQYNLSFFGRLLVENAEIDLNFGRRYGLVGANGSGKSTFLQSLAAREVPIPPHIDVYLLNQEAEPTEYNATQYVIQAARDEVSRLERELEDILAEDDGADDPRLEDLYDRIAALDPATFESRASTLLYGLGFLKDMMAKKTKDMSGGWRMRVALAKALFIRPTLLLLDEPTNHLDLEACVWLEEYLKQYNRILVLVSHSQDFLNGVCTNIINLNHQRKLIYYGGNYDVYVRTRAEQETNQMKAYHKQQEEIAHIKKFIASAGTYANLVRQAKSKQKIIDKMEAAGLIEKVDPPAIFKFKFNDVEKLPPPVLQFDQVSFSYDGSAKNFLYEDLDLAVDMDSRVALVGPNGVGKSTLLKLMVGDLQPVRGRIARHTNLKLAKYNQHSAEQLEMDLSPIQYLRKKFAHLDGDVDFWRNQIGRYGLTGAHQTGAIGTLSDGLKTRLVFAEIVLMTPDIILMDEPTNHLDMESIDSLAKAIKGFSGGVVLVSHDFRLISQVAEDIWLCKDQTITPWKGSIESYKRYLAKETRESRWLFRDYSSSIGLIPAKFNEFDTDKEKKKDVKNDDGILLYLWRNDKCVVIGRNQNPWKECNMNLLRGDGISVVRRQSGGGAVFHDPGNTNYTVVMSRTRFTRHEHVEIVARALREGLGIPSAKVNERHDIVVNDGLKISFFFVFIYWDDIFENSFKLTQAKAYHHGTMLIESDLSDIGRYLHVDDKQSLITKGVESVRSSVTNLQKYSSTVNHETFCRAVLQEFQRYYLDPGEFQFQPKIVDESFISQIPKVLKYRDELKVRYIPIIWKWTFGQTPEFTHDLEKTFTWGHVRALVKSQHGLITAITLSTLNPNCDHNKAIRIFQAALEGRKYADFDEIDEAIRLTRDHSEILENSIEVIREMAEWLKKAL